MAIPTVVEDYRFAQLGGPYPSLVVLPRGRVPLLEVVTPAGKRFAVDTPGKMPAGNVATSLVDLDGKGIDELLTRESIIYRGAYTDPIYWYTIFKWEGDELRDVSSEFPGFYQEVALPPLSYLDSWFRWAKLNVAPDVAARFNPLSPSIQLTEIGFVRLRYQRLILGKKDAGLEQALRWSGSHASDIAVLGVRSLSEMESRQAWDQIKKLTQSPDYAVCTQARGVWLARLRRPFTEADECPRPRAREH